MSLTSERSLWFSSSPTGHRAASFAPALLLSGIILSAFFLRIYNLAFESFDIDEADGLFLAQADFSTLLSRMGDPGANGPLYYLLLRLWAGAVGHSEFALRYFSLIPSVLAVPLLFVLGKRLVAPKVGLTAALLLTVSSYLLFYAQMSKMYSLLLLLSLLSSYLLLRGLERPQVPVWVAYTAGTTIALFTHIFGALLVPWHALFVVLTLQGHKRALVPWLVSLGALTLPYLPLGLQRIPALRVPETLSREFTGPQEPLGMLAALAREYGTRFDLLPPLLLAGMFLALAGGGLAALVFSGVGNRKGSALLFIGLGVIVPLLLTAGMVALGSPLFASRYLIITAPSFFLLWAAGIVALAAKSRALGLIVLLGFVLVNGLRWGQTNIGGQRFREDWRGAVAYLEQRYSAGDLLLVLHASGEHALRYYQSRPLLVANLDDGPGRPPDPLQVPGVPTSGRLWLLGAYFESGDLSSVESWLGQQNQIVSQKWLPGVKVNQYLSKRPLTQEQGSGNPLAVFADRILLRGYRPGPLPQSAGAPWQITLEWQSKEPLQEAFWASVRLQDLQGRIWGRSEGAVGGEFYPTERWPAGFSVQEVRELTLVPGTPPGDYRVSLQLYRPQDLEPLYVRPTGGEDSRMFLLETLHLTQPIPAEPKTLPGYSRAVAFENGLVLAGVALEETILKAGQPIPITLFWSAERGLAQGLEAVLALQAENKTFYRSSAPLGTPAFPAAQGPREQIVAQKIELLPPTRLLKGRYTLALEVRAATGSTIRPRRLAFPWEPPQVTVATVAVDSRPRSFQAPVVGQKLGVSFGGIAELLGYDLHLRESGTAPVAHAFRPGDRVAVTLFWKAVGETEVDYQVFVHLLDPRRSVRAQHDGFPGKGEAPTTSWVTGEVLEDSHTFTIPQGVPSGEYSLEVGLYDWRTQQRLKTPAGDDTVLIGPFTVTQ